MQMIRNGVVVLVLLGLAAGCSLLPKPTPKANDQYMLEYPHGAQAAEDAAGRPVMLVSVPIAHGGYDTSRIAYMQQAYGLRYYTRSRWADTPARMLAPLMASAIQSGGEFQAMHTKPGSIAARLRLDSELVRFHQDFTRKPSTMHITLRAQLIDLRANKLIATRLFEVTEPADTEDTYGGVVAANRAMHRLLDELAEFCNENRR